MKNSLSQNKRTPKEEQEYCLKAASKIVMLCAPAKSLSVSKLMWMKSSQLDEIGKAVRGLYDVLEKSGLVKKF